jgi:hypothetical protein
VNSSLSGALLQCYQSYLSGRYSVEARRNVSVPAKRVTVPPGLPEDLAVSATKPSVALDR